MDSLSILLCKVDSDSFAAGTEAGYADQLWIGEARDSKTFPPGTMP